MANLDGRRGRGLLCSESDGVSDECSRRPENITLII